MTAETFPLRPDGVPAHTSAGTPFPLAAGADEALAALEFEAALALVAAHAAGPLGAGRTLSRRPSSDVEWIRAELADVTELAAVLRAGQAMRVEPVLDPGRPLALLRVEGSVLDGAELVTLRLLLVAARLTAAELEAVSRDAPRAALLRVPLPDRVIERRLELSLDADGQLLDTASPRLAAARREVRTARDRLVQKLEALLRGLDQSAGEGAVTLRGGRYVIPVRRDARGRLQGIIRDESSSGGTLFVEPAETIDLGNALREAEADEEREILRVLRELTELLRPERERLLAALEMCVAADDRLARARYAVAARGLAPQVAPAPAPLRLIDARHPLLLAQLKHVVPFDLALDGAERTILLSGPNTGGKTVLLKATGLAAALTQSGVIPPVGAGSTLPVFASIFADIGDRQSIAASLSTFSAHVRTLRRILEDAGSASLVLLDEVGSGTDPAEGGALASAALASLTARGAVTLATTHLGALKQLATTTPGIVNASLQFDAEALTPTFRLLKGVPGRSYGLAIARRLGVPEPVVRDAEAQVPDAEKALDGLLAAVERRARELAEREAAATGRTLELEGLAARLERQAAEQAVREAALKTGEKQAEKAGRAQAKAYLLEARQRVEQAIALARAAVDEITAREARRLVEEGVQAEARALVEAEREEAARARTAGVAPVAGDRVRLPSGIGGIVLEVRADGKVVVGAGAVKMVLEPQLVAVDPSPAPKSKPSGAARGPGDHAAPADSVSEIDLRGFTGDEAEAATIAALDAAVMAEHPYLRIIHGMGTGVVRERVQRVLSSDRRVLKYAFAPRNQGGTGVTIAEFRA